MKPEEQRIAIAEACGTHQVVRIPFDHGVTTHITDTNGRIRTIRQIDDGPRNEAYPHDWIPLADYLNSLDAMHEAWLTISPYQKDRFESELHSVVIGLAEFNRNDDAGWITNATATQRAEAFLKTLNLWKDDN
jgi:hypothetical protein